MDVAQSRLSGATLIVLTGEIDRACRGVLADAIDDAFREAASPQHLLLEMTQCPFMDGAGLRILIDTRDRLPADGCLGLIGASPDLLGLLELIGLGESQQLRVFGSEQEARIALHG